MKVTRHDIKNELTNLVSIANRTRPGQVTHKIAEIMEMLDNYVAEVIGENEEEKGGPWSIGRNLLRDEQRERAELTRK